MWSNYRIQCILNHLVPIICWEFVHSIHREFLWKKIYLSVKYPLIGEIALRVLIPFTSTYLCECGFHHLAVIKTKYRERLRNSLECNLRCCLSKKKPEFKKLAESMQAHGSHSKWSKNPKKPKDKDSEKE